MFEKWTQHLNSIDLGDIAYNLARRIRRKKPIDPLDPLPQTKPLPLSEELTQIVDEIQAEIEAQYKMPIAQIDEETERQILNEFHDLSYEKLKSAPDYDPEEVKKLIDDLLNTVPYHRSLRYGRVEFVDGKLVEVRD